MRDAEPARAFARLLILCAVLTGVFVMHGLPAQACTAGTGMPATAMTAMAGQGEETVAAVLGHKDQAAAQHADPAHGAPCVFTPAPRGIDILTALSLLAAAAVALVSPVFPKPGGDRWPRSRRPPPGTGAELLTTLCVSRR
jgi:hypothetical protein